MNVAPDRNEGGKKKRICASSRADLVPELFEEEEGHLCVERFRFLPLIPEYAAFSYRTNGSMQIA